jgi:hypothetical protein
MAPRFKNTNAVRAIFILCSTGYHGDTKIYQSTFSILDRFNSI